MSRRGEYVEFSVFPGRRLKGGELAQVITPYGAMLLGVVRREGPLFRVHIKGQLQLLAEYFDRPLDEVLSEIRFPLVNIVSGDHVYMFAKVYTRGRLSIPVCLVEHLGRETPLFLKLTDPSGRVYELVKIGTERIRTLRGKVYREYYIQAKGLPQGVYYVEIRSPAAYLSSLKGMEISVSNRKVRVIEVAHSDITREGRYTFVIGKGILSLEDVNIDVTVKVDVLRNRILLTQQVIGKGDEELRPVKELGGKTFLEIRLRNEVYDVISLSRHVRLEGQCVVPMYLASGVRSAGERTMERKVLITPKNIIDQSSPMFHALLRGVEIREDYMPVVTGICLKGEHIGLTTDGEFWYQLGYWDSIGFSAKKGELGEKLVYTLKDAILDFTSQRLGIPREELTIKHMGEVFRPKEVADFEIRKSRDNQVVAFVEVSLGADLNRTLKLHLVPETQKRFSQKEYASAELALLIALEYDLKENDLKMKVFLCRRGEEYIDCTREFFELVRRRRL